VDAERKRHSKVFLDRPLHERRTLMQVGNVSAKGRNHVYADGTPEPQDLASVNGVQQGERAE
jgi:hypothetical protein